MLRFVKPLLVFAFAFIVGSGSVYVSEVGKIATRETQPASVTITAFNPIPPGDPVPYIPEESNCGNNWLDEAEDLPVVRKWSRGELIKDGDYCSGTTTEARGVNLGSAVLSTELIDLNGDGKDELSVKRDCSATGNCEMKIYSRTKSGYRTIFADAHNTQYFELKGPGRFGYLDIWSFMHGSWNGGDMVLYRYDGSRYRALSCYGYQYKVVNGKANDFPTLELRRGSRNCE